MDTSNGFQMYVIKLSVMHVKLHVFASQVIFMGVMDIASMMKAVDVISGLYRMIGTDAVKCSVESIAGLALSCLHHCACRAPGRHANYFQLE